MTTESIIISTQLNSDGVGETFPLAATTGKEKLLVLLFVLLSYAADSVAM
jgi:hypothetical protein